MSTNLPGHVTSFVRGAVSFEAGRVLGDYLDGTLDAAGWQAHLAALGVAALDVSQLGA